MTSPRDAYDMVDRFLRNNLGDDDYAEYSAALDALAASPIAAQEPQTKTNQCGEVCERAKVCALCAGPIS